MMATAQIEMLRSLREAGMVQRCHTMPHHGSTRLDSHQWQCLALLKVLHPKPSMNLVWHLAFHDVGERWTGDVPSSAKKSHEPTPEEREHWRTLGVPHALTDEEWTWVRAIDKLEFYLWCLDQEALGNVFPRRKKERTYEWLISTPEVPDPVRAFVWAYKWDTGREIYDL